MLSRRTSLPKIIARLAGVALAIALVYFVFRKHHEDAGNTPPTDLDAEAAMTSRENIARGDTTRDKVVDPQTQTHAPVMDKKKRDEMREAIYRAWGMAPPNEQTHPDTWPTPSLDQDAGGFGKDYVRQRVREDYIPLAKDCYVQGLKKNPTLAGKLVVNMRIVGSKNTGGLVDWVDTSSEDNTLDDKDVVECLKQSMYTVTFDPPPNDGVVTVTYPLTFSPDPLDGGER